MLGSCCSDKTPGYQVWNAQDVAGGGEPLILGPELASVSTVSPPAIVVTRTGTRTTPYYPYLDTHRPHCFRVREILSTQQQKI